MDKLPLPDLYLIDSHKLLKEVDRIRGLVLAVPPTLEAHAAMQSVIDALWHLRRDMEDIIKVQRDIHSAFAQKADALTEASQPVRVGLRIIS